LFFRHNSNAHLIDNSTYSVNISVICTGKPKNSCDSFYCGDLEPNLQYFRVMTVYLKFAVTFLCKFGCLKVVTHLENELFLKLLQAVCVAQRNAVKLYFRLYKQKSRGLTCLMETLCSVWGDVIRIGHMCELRLRSFVLEYGSMTRNFSLKLSFLHSAVIREQMLRKGKLVSLIMSIGSRILKASEITNQ
jgi:hypothetical protein